MKSLVILTASVLALFMFQGCDIMDLGNLNFGDPNFHGTYTYDTVRISIDSLSLWSTADTGYIFYPHTFGRYYMNITVSFYGETNIDGTTIPGEPVIDYMLYNGEFPLIGDSVKGFTSINGYYNCSSYLSGDKITFEARYKGGTGGTLKHVGLKSVYVEGVAIVYKP